jgi:hypothetical protein
MQMRNDDIVFMANAKSFEAAKLLTFVNLVASTAVGVGAAVQTVPITEAAVHGRTLTGAVATGAVVTPP